MHLAPISEAIQARYLQPYYVNWKHVEEAVENPTSREALKIEDATTLGMYVKTTATRYGNRTLLVSAKHIGDDLADVQQVFKIPSELADDGVNPLQVLRRFIDRFGHTIRLNDVEGRFFYNTHIPVRNKERPEIIMTIPQGAAGRMGVCFVGDPDAEQVAGLNCILAFSVDAVAYKRWVG